MRERERGGDGASERVADQRGLREPYRVHEAAERVREIAETVMRPRLGRFAESRQVDRIHGGAIRERTHVVTPRLGESSQPVDEDDGGTASFDDIVQAEPVDLSSAKLQLRHGATILQDGTAAQGKRTSAGSSGRAGVPSSRFIISAFFPG